MLLYLNHEGRRAVRIAPLLSELKSLIGQRNLVAIEQTRVSRPRGVVLSYDDNGAENNGGGDIANSRYVPSFAFLPLLYSARDSSLFRLLEIIAAFVFNTRRQRLFPIFCPTPTPAPDAMPTESV